MRWQQLQQILVQRLHSEMGVSDTTYTGGCFCGAIRFDVSGAIKSCCFCHCESCRRASGGAYVPWVTFDKAQFAVTQGELALHSSSPGATRGHCPACGTSLTYEHAERPNDVDIAVVAFDDPDRFSPVSHIWMEDNLKWVAVNDGLPQHRTWASADED